MYNRERYLRDKFRRTHLQTSEQILSSLAGSERTELGITETDPVMRQREELAIRLIRCCVTLDEYDDIADPDVNYDWDALEHLAGRKYYEIARTVEIADGVAFPVADDFKPYLLDYIRRKREEDFQ